MNPEGAAMTESETVQAAAPDDATASVIARLMQGALHWFGEWPIADLPLPPTGVYTIWDRDGKFIYVGIAGTKKDGGKQGMWGRLNSHARGWRSGNQFCVYVSDRLVLPSLHNRLADVSAGSLSIDAATCDYIRSNFGFRFSPMPCAISARKLEQRIKRGEFGPKPFLNGESQKRQNPR